MSNYRILSVDGGGMCGVIPLRFMQLLRLDDVSDFDMLVGTSTGGIIVVGLASGLTVGDIKDFYYSHGPMIFHRCFWRRVFDPWALRNPLYRGENLKKALKACFPNKGNNRFVDVKPKVMVPAYDYQKTQPYFFKSWHSEAISIRALDVCMATAAAPTYFEAYGRFVDGGLFANNPALCAVIEAVKLGVRLENIEVISLGTGKPVINTKDNKGSGLIGWATEVMTATLSASVDVVHHLLTNLPLAKYDRFDVPKLPIKFARMDDARHEVLRYRELMADLNFSASERTCLWLRQES